MSSEIIILLASLAVWLGVTGLIWKNSLRARREFPGGPGRLFVAQAVTYSVWLFGFSLARVIGDALEMLGVSAWAGIAVGVAAAVGGWALLRYGVPYTREAARDWERWAH